MKVVMKTSIAIGLIVTSLVLGIVIGYLGGQAVTPTPTEIVRTETVTELITQTKVVEKIRTVTVTATLTPTTPTPEEELPRELIEAAKREGKIRVVLFPGFRVVVEAFQKKFGIEVEAIYTGAPGVQRRVLEESEAGIFNIDVFASSSGPLGALTLKWTQKYEARNLANVKDAVALMEPQFRGFFHPAVLQVTGVIYNEKLVKQFDLPIPEDINDLLDPKWKGNFIMRSPWLGSNFNWAILAYYAYFDQDLKKLEDFLSKMYAQAGRFEPSWGKLHAAVGLGEFAGGVFTLPYTFREFGRDFPDLRYAALNFKGKMLWWWNGVGIHKNAPNPNAAKLFVEFFLSKEGLKVLAENGYITAIKGLYDEWHRKFIEKWEFANGDLLQKLTNESLERRDFWRGFLQKFAK